MIDENQDTIGKWLKDTDSANIKRIWNAFLYLRGMRSRVGLKSIPVDFIIFDELDEGPQNAIDMAMERMGHSEFKRVLMLVQPYPARLRHRQGLPGDRSTVLAAEVRRPVGSGPAWRIPSRIASWRSVAGLSGPAGSARGN